MWFSVNTGAQSVGKKASATPPGLSSAWMLRQAFSTPSTCSKTMRENIRS